MFPSSLKGIAQGVQEAFVSWYCILADDKSVIWVNKTLFEHQK